MGKKFKAGLKGLNLQAGQSADHRLLIIGRLAFSALLFALSFPGFHSDWGWPPLAFVCLAPVFGVIKKSRWSLVWFYGFFYGWLAYLLFNYWAFFFDEMSLIVIPVYHGLFSSLLFVALKGADRLFPARSFWPQTLVWVAHEYLRTLGWLAYPYGIIGYSQYLFLPFIQSADFFGVWIVSLLVVWPSAFLGHRGVDLTKGFIFFLKRNTYPLTAYGLVFLLNLAYGAYCLAGFDYLAGQTWRVALIQPSADPWQGGDAAYEKNTATLMDLSDKALAENKDLQAIVWPETAFVPSLEQTLKQNPPARRVRLVNKLIDFLSSRDVPFIFGNNQITIHPDRPDQLAEYNAAVYFDHGKAQDVYRKVHLVPLTEYFPYQDSLPQLARFIDSRGGRFLDRGDSFNVMDIRGVKIGTPICFEDVFGYISRAFVRQGSQALVNLTNDYWSQTVAAEMQHMAIALFRAIENRRPLLRGSNSGMSCLALATGRIAAMLPPFTSDYLIVEAPLGNIGQTWYNWWGDAWGLMVLVLAVAVLLIGYFGKNKKSSRNNCLRMP